VLRWAAIFLERGRPAVKPGDDKTVKLKFEKLQQEIRKLAASADQAETELARTRGKLLDADEVANQWSVIGIVIRNALENIPAQVVPLALSHGMPHESSIKLHAQVEELIQSALRHLSDEGSRVDRPGPPIVLSQSLSATAMEPERMG
jgi:phage terminase Nu1 subunit (DNA packaging protein)